MVNAFDTNVALDVGIVAAILYKNIQYWCEKNRTNGQNEYDGLFWTYNSIKAFTEQFPYLTKRQIDIALKTLEQKGYIKSGNYNKQAYDRTKWYADLKNDQKREMEYSKNVKSISRTGEMEFTQTRNGIHAGVKPIPNINTNNNTNNIFIGNEKKDFVKPTLEEIALYCHERNNFIDPQSFIDYYEANGWKFGKNNMRDWKAAVRSWERNSKNIKRSSKTKWKTGAEAGILPNNEEPKKQPESNETIPSDILDMFKDQ